MAGGIDIKVRTFIEVFDVLSESDEADLVFGEAQRLDLGLGLLQQGAVPASTRVKGLSVSSVSR